MKKAIIVASIVSLYFLIFSYSEKQEAKELLLIQAITEHKDARVVWSEAMSDGESRNFTYWNNDHCMGVIGIRNDKSYYVSGSHCSKYKLTK